MSVQRSLSGREVTRRKQPGEQEKREVDYYVRAKTGPGRQDWSGIGVAFKKGDVLTVKLNTLPINMQAWDGVLVLVPPFADGDEESGEYDRRGDDN